MFNQTTDDIFSVDIRDMNSDGFVNDDVQYDTRCALLNSVYDSEIIDCVNKWEPTSLSNDIIVCPTDEPYIWVQLMYQHTFQWTLQNFREKKEYMMNSFAVSQTILNQILVRPIPKRIYDMSYYTIHISCTVHIDSYRYSLPSCYDL